MFWDLLCKLMDLPYIKRKRSDITFTLKVHLAVRSDFIILAFASLLRCTRIACTKLVFAVCESKWCEKLIAMNSECTITWKDMKLDSDIKLKRRVQACKF